MPTYEYQCQRCGYAFEQFQVINAGPLRKCPKCGRHSLRRLIGLGSGIIFKGSGFYETDYRSESYKKAQKSEKAAVDKGNKENKSDKKAKDSEFAEKTETKGKKKTKSA